MGYYKNIAITGTVKQQLEELCTYVAAYEDAEVHEYSNKQHYLECMRTPLGGYLEKVLSDSDFYDSEDIEKSREAAERFLDESLSDGEISIEDLNYVCIYVGEYAEFLDELIEKYDLE